MVRERRDGPEATLESIRPEIARAFGQAQSSIANHKKNAIVLFKLHHAAGKIVEHVTTHAGAGVKLVGEKAFEDEWFELLSRVLVVKKGEASADKIIKFVATYIRYMNEKIEETKADDEDDTLVTRFVAKHIKVLKKGFSAKDRNVRYRCISLISEMVSVLGEINEEEYFTLRGGLVDRIQDKESTIRMQAVSALGRLCGAEDPEDLQGDDMGAVALLLETMAHDPFGEVRRAAMLNIPLTSETLKSIIIRTRDKDATVRRAAYDFFERNVYAQVEGVKMMGHTHPRAMTIAQRETVIRNGLGDREPSVKAAAGKLVSTWVEVAALNLEPKQPGEEEQPEPSSEEGILALLHMFDLAEGKVAEDTLTSLFKNRPDIFNDLVFDEPYWQNLTPERAFLGRVFVHHCIVTKNDARLEHSLPVVITFVAKIQNTYNDLMQDMSSLPDGDEDEEDRREEERMDREFILGETLRLAVDLDYADETGRRQMSILIREMIGQEALPEGLVTRCLDILRVLSQSEKDLIRIVVEVVHELRDLQDEDEDEIARELSMMDDDDEGGPSTSRSQLRKSKAFEDMTAEERARSDAMDLRCLDLCIGMLERVNGTFEENATLEGILKDLVIPAVQRKEMALRERGLTCLGLCCLIARSMAIRSFMLFQNQLVSSPTALKLRVLHIVFDILMVNGDFLTQNGVDTENGIIAFLLKILDEDESDAVQALVAKGFAKLLLARMIPGDPHHVLLNLAAQYLSPDTASNHELRQCLTFFFPIYAYSSIENQQNIRKLFIEVYKALQQVYNDTDDDANMLQPGTVALIFQDWTDPTKVTHTEDELNHDHVQLDLAYDVIKELYGDELNHDAKKALATLLGKLTLPTEPDDNKLRSLKLLVNNLQKRKVFNDAPSRAKLIKFEESLDKKYAETLADFTEEEWRNMNELTGDFEFLDLVGGEEDDEEDASARRRTPAKKGTRKRRSDSMATSQDGSGEERETIRKQNGKAKASSKRARLDTPAADEEESDAGTPPPAARKARARATPKRAAASRKTIVDRGSNSEGDDAEKTPEPRKRPPPRKKPISPSPSAVDSDDEVADSLAGSDSDE